MPRLLPYFDPSDNTFLGRLSPEKVLRYIADGTAYAGRDARGRVRRLYRAKARGPAYLSAGWLTAASKATVRVANDAGALTAYRLEFKERIPARFGDPPVIVMSPRAVPAVENADA